MVLRRRSVSPVVVEPCGPCRTDVAGFIPAARVAAGEEIHPPDQGRVKRGNLGNGRGEALSGWLAGNLRHGPGSELADDADQGRRITPRSQPIEWADGVPAGTR